MIEKLSTARLQWQESIPESEQFGDIYFNREGGVAETEHVFLNANHLEERFAAHHHGSFVIAETGFGTGLNFLCARALWLKKAPREGQLHFISCEKYPLTREDLARALSAFPQFAEGAAQLIESYPEPVPGFFTLRLDQGRVLLTLLLGDALETLPQLDARVDAWFLDGFAPAKNPELWNDQLFMQIARLSRPGTTCATFTAAGIVRRGLQAVGFEIRKVPGFGRKREMISGTFMADPLPGSPDSQPIWFQRPVPDTRKQPVVVIGAGLAGASTARALADLGYRVHVLERQPEPALEGSGNPQGALYAKLPAKPTAHSRFHLAGLSYTAGLIRQLHHLQADIGQLCGVLQLATSDKEYRRQQQLVDTGAYPHSLVHMTSEAEASALTGQDCPYPGLFFPDAGWVSPPTFCRHLLDHPLIECHYNTQVQALQLADNGWLLDGTSFSASHVVVCCANEALRFEQLVHLPLKPIRGQTSQADQPDDARPLKTVVCGEGYISPPLNGRYCFGASFKLRDTDLEVREEEHRHNLDILCRALPRLGSQLTAQPLQGRVALRCSSADYLPLVGPVPDLPAFIDTYAKLRDDARWPFDTPPPLLPGLFVNTGHGSKGLISCPISAQLVAALISGAPLPLEAELANILNPARFTIKNLIRQTL
ncbi:bifunctional tRNA (5-methylaminomethyl-2-thiouridine)(34)-methyltransferase MnmD/FAD-dependent 5-carboxymethylaminomethyl-2-thiouridine(34) oxidoreductase MnmC [Marinobacterium sediminicola]|uniref:tRNA 5-methylaminomethyl-2-thiouridine biosynthesis bifunctional protein MnmC n=1 Tax=Marinobacterium sediminicola TaxID=518898 RepID=A0ABY1RYC9_9GAMM|nr:bifunctional tRNA (5-methylaminomethyl-2-thiouridine)(34)-methyltransferase MnmD/FAD-dependent 5-carboxymethylaminomethyl-2-thiouridine(34) oxidoreductase MnmC [Marinobacterium sediminicola]ULG68732.1 bifunctional tRNA (5-methylaminomethyl-2-thiouridine)(34)-methyltransferase MnmD/FAD-dependent 5-carboxymethylaminomethyl-2-thiouridine(34) oxidoreductase MnmC [Marinobacterium sediminicola]SMR73258.1 tRNA 5-methylaminomethyl-2-thiouridine biosynthesis bifunctional protein [Marinobacterium sedimi